MATALLALGGNQDVDAERFRSALDRLARDGAVEIVRISRVYRTAPMGENAGDDYRNAAAVVQCQLDPMALLDRMQAVETDFGRTRSVRWGPRPLDLDLIAYDSLCLSTERLTLPHPGCWYRRFVLDPLVEVAGEAVHPEKGITFHALRERLLPRPLPIAFAGGDDAARERMMAELQLEFPQADCQEWSAAPPDAALTLWLGLPSAPQKSETGWEALPPYWRLNLTCSHEPLPQAARSALQAALGATAPESASR